MPVSAPARKSEQTESDRLSDRSGTNAPAPLAFAAVILANVALAFGPLLVRMADTGPVASAFWRITLAAPVLALVALIGPARPRMPGKAQAGLWGLLLIGGIAFAGDLGAWHIGIRQTTMANATLFGNSATFIFPLYGFLVARAWPSRSQGIALILAAAGAGLLMGRSYQVDPRHLVGDLLCVLAGVLYAVYFILMSRVRVAMPPMPALAWSTMASIVPLFVFAVLLGERVWPDHWSPLILLALGSQIIGQGLMIYALGLLSPLVVGLALLVQPMVATAIGWIVYGETLALPDLAGVAMVAAALVLVRRGSARAVARPDDRNDGKRI
ncbi:MULTISPECIES: DMT family transporter [unclassified Sphingomonas]|uniref:DMT family transporter n=1 Tax=unclassified Sphingomonas TaxID=196159 RepID=UPI002860DDE6|nr:MULTISPECIES: DMT family transporter [unclassified Sphingomonas]MDR6114331.1 drug/metabolite transporter (DMT)-like permease [Sphingomonas sp. SORGH_AS_0789]MDR6144495.1 drug/metabolite transporter (DMT)-like permease [Sphingomonas sp. SORGH_AS_0870]MDR6148309.1 drug/metabolite transporter (DMT)-like permease [Sphingomonas sp. SORGH_AS_0742]